MNAELIKTFSVGIFTATAAVMDYRKRTIKNNFVLIVFACAWALLLATESFGGFVLGLSSMFAAFVAILPLYLLKIIGGGDLKFFVAISPLLNWKIAVVTLLTSLIWASLLGVIQILLRGQGKELIMNFKLLLLRQKLKQSELHQMPFVVALFFGYLTAISLQNLGIELL